MEKKPKIAILTIRNTYSYGGVFATLKIVYDFCQQYFDPTVFVTSFDPAISAHVRPPKFTSSSRSVLYHGMSCIEVGARWAFWEPGHYAFAMKEWEQVLAGYDYFFVVSATPVAGHPLALLHKKFVLWASTPYDADRIERVKALRGIRKIIDRAAHHSMLRIERDVLQAASVILPLSSYSQEQFSNILLDTQKPMAICGYPVAGALPVVKITMRTLLAVGRFNDPRKNIGMLMRVFARLSGIFFDLKLCIVGAEPSAEVLQPFIDTQWFERVTFTGPVDRQALEHLYQEAGVMLITSYQEGFGIAGLEALAHGVPIVATDCGGVRDFVIDQQTGYLVGINDDDAMVNRVQCLLEDEQRYQAFSQAALELIVTKFSYDHVYGMFVSALIQTYPELKATIYES